MKSSIAIAVVVSTLLMARALAVQGETGSVNGRSNLTRALVGAWLPLESGLAVSAREGTPLSAKYEIEDGAFQLSVYTWKADTVSSGDSFTEVIVDFSTGLVARVDTITGGNDLAAAQGQKATMARAKRSLGKATADAVSANAGYRAVSAMPGLDGSRPLAEVTLVRGDEWKIITVGLDLDQ